FMDKKLKDNFITISNIITLSTLMDNIHTSILENKITTLSVNDNGKTPSNRDMVETRKSYHKQKGLNTLKLNLLMNGSSKGFEYEWDLLEFTFSIESARCLYKALSEYHQYLKGV
ncbi:MAG: hypothetical protein RSE41_07705, partial [Clostridia bacterium]